jgi:hypothetical protein
MKTIRLVSEVDTITLLVDGVSDIDNAKVSIKTFDVSTYRPRLGVQSRYGKSGGEATGDREVDPRDITIGLDLTTTEGNDYDYIQSMDTILGFFRPENGPFYIYDDQDDASGTALPRRARIDLKEENLTGKGVERRIMSGTIKLVMLDGLWEVSTAETYENPTGGLADQDTFTLTNSSKFRAYPVYTITALTNNSLFKITNTTSDVFMEIGTSDFYIGESIIIDAVNGSITIDGVDIIATSLSDGSSFPDLLAGANVMEYESAYGACELSIEWRSRFAR